MKLCNMYSYSNHLTVSKNESLMLQNTSMYFKGHTSLNKAQIIKVENGIVLSIDGNMNMKS